MLLAWSRRRCRCRADRFSGHLGKDSQEDEDCGEAFGQANARDKEDLELNSLHVSNRSTRQAPASPAHYDDFSQSSHTAWCCCSGRLGLGTCVILSHTELPQWKLPKVAIQKSTCNFESEQQTSPGLQKASPLQLPRARVWCRSVFLRLSTWHYYRFRFAILPGSGWTIRTTRIFSASQGVQCAGVGGINLRIFGWNRI